MNNTMLKDDPYRVAPPYQAPGEIEPREPTLREIVEMEAEVEREVLESLKQGTDFTVYGLPGCYWSRRGYDYLCDSLLDELSPYDIAQIMAAVLDFDPNREEQLLLVSARDILRRKAITPFVEEQARLRMDRRARTAGDMSEPWMDA